jgi:hypothetical protein
MLNGLMLLSLVAVAGQAPTGTGAPSYPPEQLAVGAVLEIISAQATFKQAFPRVGYACSLEQLVEAQMLRDTWLAGQRVDGYAFRVWCETKATPRTTYRASGVPAKRTKGAALTVCTDETNTPRTIDGDVPACFARGLASR